MESQYIGKLCDDSSPKSGVRIAAKAPSRLRSSKAKLAYYCNMMWLPEAKYNFEVLAFAQLRYTYSDPGIKEIKKSLEIIRKSSVDPRRLNLQKVSKTFLDTHGAYIWPNRKLPCPHLKQPSEDLESSLDFWNLERQPGDPHSSGPFYHLDAKVEGQVKRDGTMRDRDEAEQVLHSKLGEIMQEYFWYLLDTIDTGTLTDFEFPDAAGLAYMREQLLATSNDKTPFVESVQEVDVE